jgi:hypothetical protein
VDLWPSSVSASFTQFTQVAQGSSLAQVSAAITLSTSRVPSDTLLYCNGSGSCWTALKGEGIAFWRIRLYVVTADGWSHLVDGYNIGVNRLTGQIPGWPFHPDYPTIGSNPLVGVYATTAWGYSPAANVVGAYIIVEAIVPSTLTQGTANPHSAYFALRVLTTYY